MTSRRDERQPLFMISIAAELAAMHPQTLRLYERRGLLRPRRSAKNTRLYSAEDVARLRRIQELTDFGLNLAGVERVLELEMRLAAALGKIERLQGELAAAGERLRADVERAQRGARRDLVTLGSTAIVRVERGRS
jgi:MerR family transcriptional regulator, heat shock protein HspR